MISKLTRLATALALMTTLSGCIVYLDDNGDFHHHKDHDSHGKAHPDEKPADEVEKTAS